MLLNLNSVCYDGHFLFLPLFPSMAPSVTFGYCFKIDDALSLRESLLSKLIEGVTSEENFIK